MAIYYQDSSWQCDANFQLDFSQGYALQVITFLSENFIISAMTGVNLFKSYVNNRGADHQAKHPCSLIDTIVVGCQFTCGI